MPVQLLFNGISTPYGLINPIACGSPFSPSPVNSLFSFCVSFIHSFMGLFIIIMALIGPLSWLSMETE